MKINHYHTTPTLQTKQGASKKRVGMSQRWWLGWTLMVIIVMPCNAESELSDALNNLSTDINCLGKLLSPNLTKTELCSCTFKLYKQAQNDLIDTYLTPGRTLYLKKTMLFYSLQKENRDVLKACQGNKYVKEYVDKFTNTITERFEREDALPY